jgi:peptidyl-prolyl cis-trans isomerase B (cyclophilin B)
LSNADTDGTQTHRVADRLTLGYRSVVSQIRLTRHPINSRHHIVSGPPGREQVPSNEQRRQAAKRKLERQLVRRAEQAKRRRMITIGTTVALVIVLVVGVFYFTNSNNSQPAAAPAPSPGAPKNSGGSCNYTETSDEPAAKPVGLPQDPKPTPAQGIQHITLKTNQGEIPINLDRAKAPCTVQSFEHLTQAKYFDNTDCHRISTEGLKMLQCGDPTGSGSGGPGYQVKDEVTPDLKYSRGTLAMANSGQPNTNGSQFFMVFGDSELPPQYTVFGTIGEPGLQVLDKVAKAGSDNSSQAGGGKPNTPVHINQAAPTS